MSTTLEKLKKATAAKFAAQKPKVAAPKAITAALPNAAERVERITISLHSTDMERLTELERYLETQGKRVRNTSLLIKVALRGIEHSPALVEHLNAAMAEDGRRGGKPGGQV